MTADPGPDIASTPPATQAVAQSRLGTPTAEPAAAESASAGAGVDGFQIGSGVERATRGRPYERQPGDPLYRPLRIFTLDPAASRLAGAQATVNVPYEPLEPGPRGALLEVDCYDGWQQVTYRAVDLDDPKVLLEDGRPPSPSDHLFHQQMVYAVSSTVYAAFQRALGRHIAWGFDAAEASADGRTRLLLRPHAFEGQNAYYDAVNRAVSFGYFQAGEEVTGRTPPWGFVFTCLAHDIVAHEVTHALLDGLRERFSVPSGAEVLAFHEAFADLVAIFQRFSYEQVVLAAIRDARGRPDRSRLLTDLAQQFGHATGLHQALRSAIDDVDEHGNPTRVFDKSAESHALGGVLVAAVFEAFTTVFLRKTERYIRLATNGTGELPPGRIPADLEQILAGEASRLAGQFLSICIRAIDYCPPVDLTLGEFLRALITADYDLVPDDPWGYREALIDAFWRRKIYPPHVRNLSEDALLWRPTRRPLAPIHDLTFANLKFEGDPGRPASSRELRRQAAALGAIVSQPEALAEFGLAAQGDPALQGDHVDLPQVESIRSARRVGPDGQIVFDLVAEVLQRRTVHDAGGRAEFDYFGGATIILGPDGRIRYAISKSVLGRTRRDSQREFVTGPGRAFWEEPAGRRSLRMPRRQLFRFLHTPSGPA